MVARLVAPVVALVAALVALVLVWPALFGLQDQLVIAQLIAFRALMAIGAIGAVVVLALLALVRVLRRTAVLLGVVVLAFAIANAGILGARGFAQQPASAAQASSADTVTVLSWNTLGGSPGADQVAKLALDHGADIVSLPETTDAFATEVAELMRAGGSPMWALGLSFSEIYEARSTAVLISPDLGEYTVESAGGTGPPGNTNVSPTVVATPDSGEGPTIVAVHAVSPLRGEMTNWRSDLDWLAAQCAAGSDVIMAGDFNATLDHMIGRGTDGGELGACQDAAAANGAAALGTWPSEIPMPLGAPIDHIMATSGWTATSFEVITSLDALGSDHRPVVSTLTRS
ncbi:MAG: endonuclease/exonuclease/phosphatase family protein [Leifsonia sp.]